MLLTLFDIALHAGQLPEGGQIQALLVADLDAHPRHAVLQFKDITLAPTPAGICVANAVVLSIAAPTVN